MSVLNKKQSDENTHSQNLNVQDGLLYLLSLVCLYVVYKVAAYSCFVIEGPLMSKKENSETLILTICFGTINFLCYNSINNPTTIKDEFLESQFIKS